MKDQKRLEIVSGDGQRVRLGTPLAPLEVIVRDATGAPIPGVLMCWHIDMGNGVIGGETETDENGISSIDYTPFTVGDYRIICMISVLEGDYAPVLFEGKILAAQTQAALNQDTAALDADWEIPELPAPVAPTPIAPILMVNSGRPPIVPGRRFGELPKPVRVVAPQRYRSLAKKPARDITVLGLFFALLLLLGIIVGLAVGTSVTGITSEPAESPPSDITK